MEQLTKEETQEIFKLKQVNNPFTVKLKEEPNTLQYYYTPDYVNNLSNKDLNEIDRYRLIHLSLQITKENGKPEILRVRHDEYRHIAYTIVDDLFLLRRNSPTLSPSRITYGVFHLKEEEGQYSITLLFDIELKVNCQVNQGILKDLILFKPDDSDSYAIDVRYQPTEFDLINKEVQYTFDVLIDREAKGSEVDNDLGWKLPV